MIIQILKKLSANDLGLTGGHQAGILVPRQEKVLGFFPRLDSTMKNPRVSISVKEVPAGNQLTFNYIHYNTKVLGLGTRNEYRLTGMTAFLKATNAKVGDELKFSRDENLSYTIQLIRSSNDNANNEYMNFSDNDFEGVLKLSSGWRVIDL